MTRRLIAYDTFTESGTGFLALTSHTAEVGGSWTANQTWAVVDRTNDYATNNAATLNGVNAWQTNALAWQPDVWADIGFVGSYTGLAGVSSRHISTNNWYMGVAFGGTGDVRLYRFTAGAYTTITTVSSSASNATRKIRFVPIGSSPTTLRVKVWNSSDAEPDAWNIDTTDNTAGNQTTARSASGIYVETNGNPPQTSYSYADNFRVEEGVIGPSLKLQAVNRAAVF